MLKAHPSSIIGLAKWTASYDERGNTIEFAYFGVDGKLALPKNGYAKYTYSLDEHGNVIEESYFGVEGKTMLDKRRRVAKCTVSYDERGNIIEQSYFGVDGKPINRNEGFARYIFQ